MTFSVSVILLQIEIHRSTMDDYVKIEKIGEGRFFCTDYVSVMPLKLVLLLLDTFGVLVGCQTLHLH